MAATRWVSWAAVSSLPQARKVSLEEQLQENKSHIERHGGKLVAELVVPGESRNIVLFEDAAKKMEAYAKLQELIKAKAFDVLIYLDRSRLGRKASLSMAVVALCEEAGIATYETENPPASISKEQSHDDALIGAIKSVGAQQEIKKFQKRHEMGMIGRIKSGKMANHAPYGYYFDVALEHGTITKHVLVHEEQAAIVRYIFTEYLDGRGGDTLAEMLNEKGIPSPLGTSWRGSSVRNIIRRRWTYAGYAEINRESARSREYVKAKGAWDAIISEDVAAQVDKETNVRAVNRHVPDTPYLLTAICYCKRCNVTMSVHKYTAYKTYKILRLDCRHGRHPHTTVSYRRVLQALEAAMIFLNEADPQAMEVQQFSDTSLQVQIAQLQQNAIRYQEGIERLDDDYYSGALKHDRYNRQMERLENKLDETEAEIAQLQIQLDNHTREGSRSERIQEARAMGVSILHHPDVTMANAWLRNHVRIYIEDGDVVEVRFV